MFSKTHNYFVFFNFLLAMASGLVYLIWLMLNLNWSYWYIAIPFIIAEINFYLLFLLWEIVIRNGLYRRSVCPVAQHPLPTVDIFITACREPFLEVKRTLLAAIRINYPYKVIYLLDDGKSSKLHKLCDRLNVNYLCRPVHEDRKAGNLNYGLAHSHSDFILTLDADQVPAPSIINALIGYFDNKDVGFVQSKQSYVLPKNDPWANSDRIFYTVMLPSKAVDNAAISCGSGVIYRRRALQSIGGFSTWNVVEDLYSSFLLHAKGWIGIYVEEAYTKGTAPADIVSQVRQRWQWAVDSLRMFFWDCPLFKKGLTFKQRWQYTHFGYNYIVFGIFLPLIFLVPIWALLTNKSFLSAPWWMYLIYRTVYYVFYQSYMRFGIKLKRRFKSFQIQSGLCFTYLTAIITALFSRDRLIKYRITPKYPKKYVFLQRLSYFFPNLVLLIFSGVAIFYRLFSSAHLSWFVGINVFWAGFTIIVLSRFVILGLIGHLNVIDDRETY